MVQHIHRNRIDHRSFLVVVLEDKHHVEVLEVKLNSFKMNQLHIFQSDHKWRLKTQNGFETRLLLSVDVINFLLYSLSVERNFDASSKLTHSDKDTRHPLVGCNNTVLLNGTPGNPNSLNGVSNSTSVFMFSICNQHYVFLWYNAQPEVQNWKPNNSFIFQCLENYFLNSQINYFLPKNLIVLLNWS